jgi:hypothetical protein
MSDAPAFLKSPFPWTPTATHADALERKEPTAPTATRVGIALLAYDIVIGDTKNPPLALRVEAMDAALKAVS